MIRSADASFALDDVGAIQESVFEILASGDLILGQYTQQFETAFAAYIGTRHAVALSSCSAALEIALAYAKRRGGHWKRRVLMPCNTFGPSALIPIRLGQHVIFTEIDPRTWCADPNDVLSLLDQRAAAVVLVHIAGFVPPEIQPILAACRDLNIPVIEDCAHAHGATFAGVKAGKFGLAGCFSFYASKIMTTGVGGMLTTDDPELDAFARAMRYHGRVNDLVECDGSDWLMPEITAALGLRQLGNLDREIAHRRRVAAMYDELLPPWIERARRNVDQSGHAFYKYAVRFDSPAARDWSARSLELADIEAGVLYQPLAHQQPRIVAHLGLQSLPRSEAAIATQLCLPMHGKLRDAEIERVCHVLGAEPAGAVTPVGVHRDSISRASTSSRPGCV